MIPRDIDAAGDTLYQNYCAVCHGPAGDAKGPVSPRIGAPSLLTARARAYTDGYIYSIIRYGRGVMPRYGDKVYLPRDRWAIVNHVRKLQGQCAGAARAAREPRRRHPPGAERDRLDRRGAAMTPTLHERLAGARSPAATLFLGLGAGSPSSALILFVSRARRRATATRLAALPRQLAVLHRSLGGKRGVRGGAEDHQRQVVGDDHPVRLGASVAFLPVSFLGAAADLHRGIRAIYGPMRRALHELPHSKAVWLSHGFMFARLAHRACSCSLSWAGG